MAKISKILVVISLFLSLTAKADENIRKVATWNMKWLGTNSGNQLDAVENVKEYSAYILRTEATLFALQEIGATHSLEGQPRCYYLDLIVEDLNQQAINQSQWSYILDDQNKNQRLAFLFRQDQWTVTEARSVRPGSSFNYIRRPFVVKIQAIGANAQLTFNYISIHLKAFPDSSSMKTRGANFQDLATWLASDTLDADVLIAGDTNLYFGESGLQQPLVDIGYFKLYDSERTAIHEDKLGQVFDRFYCSSDLKKEIDSAKAITGFKDYIDVIKDNDPDKIIWFDQNISDHYPVIIHIDVSKER